MKYRWLVILSGMLYAAFAMADPPEGYNFVKYDEGVRQAQKQNKKIFLYLGRYGCGFCDKTNKESFSDKEIEKIYKENYVLVYVDSESADRLTLPSGEVITEQQLAARLRTLVTPYFLYLEPNGELIFKAPGFKTVKDFKSFHRYVSGGYYKNMSLAEFSKQEPK